METKFPSPNKKYLFQIEPWEARMSLWVETPCLIEVQNKAKLFDLRGTDWSLDSAQWLNEERVTLSLRRYPGDHSPRVFEVVIDCLANQATFDGTGTTLDQIEPYLESIYRHCQINVVMPHPPSILGRLRRLIGNLWG